MPDDLLSSETPGGPDLSQIPQGTGAGVILLSYRRSPDFG
jgi:hypothetical protein